MSTLSFFHEVRTRIGMYILGKRVVRLRRLARKVDFVTMSRASYDHLYDEVAALRNRSEALADINAKQIIKLAGLEVGFAGKVQDTAKRIARQMNKAG